MDDILIREVPFPGKTGKKEFLFLFDYGDEWRFGVKLLDAKGMLTPGAEYPRVTASRGDAPEQYPPWDDEEMRNGTTRKVIRRKRAPYRHDPPLRPQNRHRDARNYRHPAEYERDVVDCAESLRQRRGLMYLPRNPVIGRHRLYAYATVIWR